MNTCKTCDFWKTPDEWNGRNLCAPLDQDTFKPMDRGFDVKVCKMPTQTFCETPIERNGFGLADASEYLALLATAEDFGCLRHSALQINPPINTLT